MGARLPAPHDRELGVPHVDRELPGARVGDAGVVASDLGLLAVGGDRDHGALTSAALHEDVELHLGAAGVRVVGVALGRGEKSITCEGRTDEDGVQGHGGEDAAQEEGHNDDGNKTHENSMYTFSLP